MILISSPLFYPILGSVALIICGIAAAASLVPMPRVQRLRLLGIGVISAIVYGFVVLVFIVIHLFSLR